MDKKTIIAVLLIAVIFIVYTMIIKQPKKQSDDTVKEEVVVEKEEKEKEKEIKKEETEKVDEKIELTTKDKEIEKLIEVQTNLYKAQFSTIGATIQSMQLLKYPGEGEEPVELIPEGGNQISISLIQDEGSNDLSQFPTICKKESIRLIGDLKDSLVFYYVKNGTPFLKKVFIFESNSYIIKLRLESLDTRPYSMKLGFDSGLMLTEKDKKDEMAYTNFVAMLGENFERMKLRNVKEEKSTIEGEINWAGVTSKYFLFFVLPENKELKKVSQWKIEKKMIGFSVTTKEIEKADFSLYFGPIDYYLLKDMGNGLEKSVYFGWNWIAPISKVIFFVFIGIHKVIPNYGVVIIAFSTIMMVVFFPLTFKSHASMQRMQKLQPKMEAIRKKHKEDVQKMNAEIMKLYSQHKVNPLGGCLPLLLQMPVFFALYAVLRSTIELRRAPFIFWITDLSMKDPYYVLPILMGAAMFFQQKLTVTDPRQKAMTYFMPLFLVFIFARLPCGIVLYWFVYNLLSILQQYLIKRGEKEEVVRVEAEE